jgi:hypothetical protein
VLDRVIEEEGREVQRRLYAHHDYFGNIIPSTWFVFGAAFGVFVFYRKAAAASLKDIKDFIHPLGEPTTGVDVLLAVVLAIIGFNLVYILGQLLNGVAAVTLDRVIVKKLLKYPFTLYELKWEKREQKRTDAQILREAVFESSYGVFCINIVPIVFFELALVAFGLNNPYGGSWVEAHKVLTIALTVVLVCTHFGIPSLRKARLIAEEEATNPSDAKLELILCHMIVVVLISIGVGLAIARAGWTLVILLLPITNGVIAVSERRLVAKYGPEFKSPAMKRSFLYMRRTFLNPAYFAAKLVGYGSSPDARLIGKAREAAGYDSRANDFYWMCQLRIENDAPRSYNTAYHGMAMYTMNRNLCNSTAFIAIASVVAFYIKWPDTPQKYLPLIWIAILCVMTYVFFIRYLYLFSGLYSKYVVRAVTFLEERNRPILVT